MFMVSARRRDLAGRPPNALMHGQAIRRQLTNVRDLLRQCAGRLDLIADCPQPFRWRRTILDRERG